MTALSPPRPPSLTPTGTVGPLTARPQSPPAARASSLARLRVLAISVVQGRPVPAQAPLRDRRATEVPGVSYVDFLVPASCSRSSSSRLRSVPPPYPVSAPSAPITRWYGTMTATGLRPLASPTARRAVGWSMRHASSP